MEDFDHRHSAHPCYARSNPKPFQIEHWKLVQHLAVQCLEAMILPDRDNCLPNRIGHALINGHAWHTVGRLETLLGDAPDLAPGRLTANVGGGKAVEDGIGQSEVGHYAACWMYCTSLYGLPLVFSLSLRVYPTRRSTVYSAASSKVSGSRKGMSFSS